MLGGRLGESIVIRTPGGAIGVVDSYAFDPHDPSTNPTLDRLAKMRAERLRFVAITHPHMDHFRGLLTVFQKYKGHIEYFWRPPFGQREWAVCFEQYIEEVNHGVTKADRVTAATSIAVLRKILEIADSDRVAGSLKMLTTDDEKVLLKEPEHDFSITSLGPSTDIAIPYQNNSARAVFRRGPHNSDVRHNAVSSVLAIKYGKWIGLLGGDTEQASWNDILDRCEGNWVAKAQFVKVSHHGSPTGSYARLWDSVRSRNCNVVLTCYEAQKLPKYSGVNFIYNKKYPLHSTNRNIAARLIANVPSKRVYMEFGGLPDEWHVQQTGEVHLTVRKNGRMSVAHDGAAGLVTAPAKLKR